MKKWKERVEKRRMRDGRMNEVMRQSNFELLRIVAMLMIVAHHFSIHGQFNFPTAHITVNRLWVQLIQMGGNIGVNIFVLISGYFLIQASGIKVSRILKLWLQLFFYSMLIYLIFVGSGLEDFHIKELVNSVFPVLFCRWWFASTYFILYLLAPFINRFLTGLERRTYQKMLVLLTVCWCIVPTFTNQSFQSNRLCWFLYLYALAAYCKLWGADIHGKKCLITAACMIGLTFLSVVTFDILGMRFSSFGKHATFFYNMQCVPVLLISFLLFSGFAGMKMGYHKIINIIASATFGVYLIHDYNLMRNFLWKIVFKNASFADSIYLIAYSILVILLVFVLCAVLELIRIYVLEKNYMKYVDRLASYIDCVIHRFFQRQIFDKL